MLKKIIFLSFLLYASLGYGQITPSDVKVLEPTEHIHHDSSYHCKGCDSHLFGADKTTAINDKELHYHGVVSAENSQAFNCAECKSHIGYLTDNLYQLSNDKLSKKKSTYNCPSCQTALFAQSDLRRSDDSFTYFAAPIDQARIAIDDGEKFYKIEREKEAINCAVCSTEFGKVKQNNATGGFGVRVNINAVNKKKRKKGNKN